MTILKLLLTCPVNFFYDIVYPNIPDAKCLWEKELIKKTLNIKNEYFYQYKEAILSKELEKKVYEIGCGCSKLKQEVVR